MNRIAELRKKMGWSQSELASYVDVAQNTISQYENELRHIPSRTVLKLSDIFGVSPNYLMGETDSPGEIYSDSKDLQTATKLTAVEDINIVNLYLRKGWKLVHIGEDRSVNCDGSGYSQIIYSLAWFGNPHHPSAIELLDDDVRLMGWDSWD